MNRPLPEVSIVIVTHDRRSALATCLESLAGLDYPREQIETLVYDNGSHDGTIEWLSHDHPTVRVIAGQTNLGFATPCNRAAAEATSSLLCLVNNDMRFAPNFLRALADAREATGAACVGARVLDWQGERIEFDGGTLNFYGHGAPRRYGERAAQYAGETKPVATLFASGGALLIERQAFLAAGGFDEDYFAYFEDVDLGWRLWILGERCVMAPAAHAYHREHGTEAALPSGRRLELLEQNALLTLYKNYQPERGGRVLRCALALLVERARLEPERAPACWRGLEGFLRALPRAERRRTEIERRRVRRDADLVELFVDPWRPPIASTEYHARQLELAELFGAADLFTARDSARRPRAVGESS